MSELRHGDIKTFSLPVGSLLTVTTVTGEAYVNQVSTAGVLGTTTRVWSGSPVEDFGPYGTQRTLRVQCLSGAVTVDQAVFELDNGASGNGSSSYLVQDDFVGGSVALFVGEIGEMGWFGNQNGSGSVIIPTLGPTDIDHPGVKALTTGTTNSSWAMIHVPSTSAFNIFIVDAKFDMTWWVNLRQTANTKAAIGIGSVAAPAALSGIRIEKEFGDSEWFAFTGDAANTTRESLGAIVAT